jgi:hypothetical protein
MSLDKDNNALIDLLEKNIDSIKLELIEDINNLDNLENKLIPENHLILEKVSLWSKVKYGLSKLGRYKAGGKIFGKRKIDQETAAKIVRILDKKGNESLKELDGLIKQQSSKGKGDFPNNQDPEIFLNIIESIAAVYDSIVEATKKNSEEKGFLPLDAANTIILDLREYVKKFLDVDLSASYSVMDSEEESESELIVDNDTIDEDRSKDVRKKLQSKVGKDAEKIESQRMKTLKSWKLPLALLGTGASFGALSWLIHYLFDPQEITKLSPEEIKSATEDTLGNIKPGEGFTQIMNRTMGMDLSPSSDPNDVVAGLSKLGGGDPNVGIDIVTQKGGIFQDPVAAKETLTQIVSNPTEHGDNLGQVFKGTWAGTGRSAGDTLVTVPGGTLKGMVVKSIIRWTTKKTVVGGSKMLIAAPILKILGIALFAGGVVVKLMREKGKRQSRSKTLNDLLQSLQLVKPTKENPPIIDIKPEDEEDPDEMVDEPNGETDEPKGDEPNGETDEPKGDEPKGDEPKGDEPKGGTGGGEPVIPKDFLDGNRNMQLAYLSKNFLPGNKSLWDRLGLKEGTVLPSGLFDAALGQGKVDQEKYLTAFFNKLKKDGDLLKDTSYENWKKNLFKKNNLALVAWIRNTRKGIGSFFKKLKDAFPEFEISTRSKAGITRPGKRGKGAGTAGTINNSTDVRYDLIIEAGLGSTANQAGFDESTFMKNLPQFMKMLASMYYGAKGSKLYYNEKAVLDKCKKFGCKQTSSKEFDKSVSDDYFLIDDQELGKEQTLSEEIIRIRQLMK